MKELLVINGGLCHLRFNTRFIYSVFLLFCVIGYGVMTALAMQRSGVSLDSIASYYRGDESQMRFGKTYGELLETTHFHLFAMPMLLFVQGHLFLLTRWRTSIKVTIVVAATLGIALDLAAPWLIVYGSADWAWTKTAARILMGGGFAAFTLVPLYEMWFVKPDPSMSPEWDPSTFARLAAMDDRADSEPPTAP